MEKGWIEVFMTAQEYEAAIAKELLENEGIKAVVLNQHDSAHQAFGELSIYVAEKDVEKATLLLKNLINWKDSLKEALPELCSQLLCWLV